MSGTSWLTQRGTPMSVDLLVLAKEPRPGRVKTRLCPPCSPRAAADLAEAALADTLAAAVDVGADRVLLALDGRPGPWCPSDVVLIRQGTGSLGERIARAWSSVNGPALQIGMDTPQVDARTLRAAIGELDRVDIDAAIGLATDGGWWCVGMSDPDPTLFLGVPTSRSDTGARQHHALVASGRRVAHLPVHRDVDTWADALLVAQEAPAGGFARAVRTTGHRAA